MLQIGELIFKLTRNSERHCPKKTCSLYRVDSVRHLLRKELKKKRAPGYIHMLMMQAPRGFGFEGSLKGLCTKGV